MSILSLAVALAITTSAPAPITHTSLPAVVRAQSDDYQKMWDTVEQAIQTRYYGRTKNKEKMDQLFAKYEPMAAKAKSRAEFSDSVNAMIDEFKDSHFDFFTPADQGYYLMDNLAGGKSEMPQFGAWFRRTPEGYVVQMILNGSEAEKAGLRKGDRVETIGTEKFTPIDSLAGNVGKKVDLRIRRGRQDVSATVEVAKTPGGDMFLQATKDSVKVIEHGGKKIGYIHVWTMLPSQASRDALHNAVYGKLRDTDAIILDIRDGFGGRPEGYGDPFFRPEVNLNWKMGGFDTKQLFGYGRPVVLLINGGSRSAKEVFAYIMKKSKRAVLMGSQTAGNVLGTSPYRINDWSIIEIPMVEVVTDGITLEGNGVKPDIALPMEFNDAGTDLYLAEALSFLTKK